MAKYSYNPKREYGSHGITYSSLRRSKKKRQKWPRGVFVLCILSIVMVCCVCYFNDINPFSSKQKAARKMIPQQSGVIRRGDFNPDNLHNDISSQNEATDFSPASVQQSISESQRSNSSQISSKEFNERNSVLETQYEKAYIEFSKGNYVAARDILRLLFESITPRDAVYRKTTSLLSKASKELYNSDKDPELSIQYTVVKGDTLSMIAKKYSTTVTAIQKANGMTNTKLSIGKILKITRSAWSIEIHRANDELFLLSNGKLFAFYKIYSGSSVPDSFQGVYKIVDKNPEPIWKVNGNIFPYGSSGNICGARWIALNPINKEANNRSTAIHGTNTSNTLTTSPGAPGYFRMSNEDIKEIYDMLPIGTRIDIFLQ